MESSKNISHSKGSAPLPPVSQAPLGELNTWKVGGVADFFCQPENKEHILYYLNWAKEKNLPVSVLSGGTNTLISDKGVEGLVMSLQKLNTYSSWEENGCLHIRALAGVPKAEIMRLFLEYKLAGALFLCGLPGDVGGGVVMNAGIGQKDIFPREFKDIVDWVTVIREAKLIKIFKKDITWGYRFSEGWEPGMLYEIGMSQALKPLPDLPLQLRNMALKRTQSQPLQSASCGSVFKNPKENPAGKLIEECGLKGHQMGHARVSEKHANFIVNVGGGTAQDIHQLIQHIQKTVKEKFDISLQPEVKYMGRWS